MSAGCIRRPGSVWTTCPCPRCRKDQARMSKVARNGRYRRVPAEAAWAVIDAWLERDWTGQAMASAVGTARRTIEGALTHYRTTGHRRAFGPTIAWKIVMSADHRPTAGLVGVLGTRRRLQALAVMRWCVAELSRRTGLPEATLHVLREGHTERVSAEAATVIADLYDELATVDGGNQRVARLAARRGWLPPLAWDDPDDPAESGGVDADDDEQVDEMAVVRAVSGRPALPMRPVDRREVVRRLTREGWSEDRLAALLGVTGKTIARDRKELAQAVTDAA